MDDSPSTPDTTTKLDLAPIRARAEAATPGPWRWYGYVDGDVYLATAHSGRLIVLDHDQPALRFRRGPTMMDARTFAVREADYRPDIARIDHPDAEFIANARADVDALLSEVARLNGAILDALGLVVAGDAEAAEALLGRMTDRIGLVGEEAHASIDDEEHHTDKRASHG